MTPRAHFWRLIETKYPLIVNQTPQRAVFGLKGDTTFSARLVDSLWPLQPVGHDGFGHSRQTCKVT